MFIPIKHRGINPKREAQKLHDMITKGFHNSLKRNPNYSKDIDEEKKKFVEALEKKEFEYIQNGFTHA